MTDYKWETTIEGRIIIRNNPWRTPPSLNRGLFEIKYRLTVNETEIELHRLAMYHGGEHSFWPGSLLGKYSKKGRYTLRSYNSETFTDAEITGKELRENMNALLREIKECWAAGDHCPTHLDYSRNFWANGDLQLLEHILEKEPSLPVSVKSMLADLAGVKFSE